jgi:cytochrome c
MGRSSLAAIALLLGAVLAHAGPLHEAAGAGDVDKVRRLLAEGEDIGEMEKLGTPLHWAASEGRLEVVEVLVAEGAKVDEPAKMRFTPLHMAARGGSRDVAAFLLASGAEIDARNALGNTPLHLAASAGHTAVVETLVASGADLNARNDADITPIQLAGVSGHFDIVDRLIVHGVSAPPVDPITDLLADAYPEKGRDLFSACTQCHIVAKNKGTPPGAPNLWGVLEREKASSDGFAYSRALTRLEGSWSYEELNAFLANPKGFAPGTSMWEFQGVKDAADRASLIVYLRENGDDPPPLPK